MILLALCSPRLRRWLRRRLTGHLAPPVPQRLLVPATLRRCSTCLG